MEDYGNIIDRYLISYIKQSKKIGKDVNRVKLLNTIKELMTVNLKLWDLEDKIRDPEQTLESAGTIGMKIAETNDKRCGIKNKLNELIGSNLKEEKEYKNK